jgi:hypothetical protein
LTGLPPTVMTIGVSNSQGTEMQKFNACGWQMGNNL